MRDLMWSTWLFLPCLLAGSLEAGQQTSVPAVDAIFSAYDRPGTPGCALGVIRDSEFIYRRGYGLANLEYDLPLGPQSVFRIGSTSKQFTATAIALLAEDGKIALDDPVRHYFPEFPGWADAMTVSQLIHHTSGIRDYLELASLAGKVDDADYYSDAWVLDLLARQRETNFPPGDQYLYSNSGYLLLAHIVQRVSGQSLRKFAGERIFEPLGMRNTHFHDDHNEIVPRRATGYAPMGDNGYRISTTTLDIVGDGSVFTTIDDLLLWDRNFYDNRLGRGGPGLITTLTTPGTLNSGASLDYAFGLRVEDFHGLPMIAHGGAFVGYRAEMLRLPQQKLSIAVLCNRSDAEPTQLARQVAMHYLQLEPAAAGVDAVQPGPVEPTTLSEEALREYVGDFWEETEAFSGKTVVEEGKLWAVHPPTGRSQLVPVGPDRFRMIGAPGELYLTFEREESGITGVSQTTNGKASGQFRRFSRRQATAKELSAYAGDYFSPELDVGYRLSQSGDRLMLEIPNAAEVELTPMFGETFESPDYGSFIFERAEDGVPSGFRLQSGRVKNLAFSRQ